LRSIYPNLNIRQYSLARQLKLECQDFIREHLQLDVFTENSKEKALFRDMLVWYADVKRVQTLGTYYTQKLEAQLIEDRKNDGVDLAIITDIRYAKYKDDEISWLKNKHGGYLVHVSKHYFYPENSEMLANYERWYTLPVNSHEELNDPKIQAAADFKVDWKEINSAYVDSNNHTHLLTDSYLNEKVSPVTINVGAKFQLAEIDRKNSKSFL
jgi:hypothetical protein